MRSKLSLLRVHCSSEFISGAGYHVLKVSRSLTTFADVDEEVLSVYLSNGRYDGMFLSGSLEFSGLSIVKLSELIRHKVREGCFDIIHLHSMPYPEITSIFLGFPIPVLRSAHEPMLTCPGWSRYFASSSCACELKFGTACILNAYIKKCQRSRMPLNVINSHKRVFRELREFVPQYCRILACSDYMIESLRQHNIPHDRIEKVPSPQEVQAPIPDNKIDNQNLRIIFAGRLSAQKGILNLLEACQKVALKLTNYAIELLIVGRGELEDRMKIESSKTNLLSIKLLGQIPRTELWDLFSSDCIVVVPSVYPDCFPNVVAEAMACGAPVVASNAGGTSEWFDDSISGHSYSSGNVRELADCIIALAQDSEMRSTIGSNARYKIASEHSPEFTARKYRDIYDRILSEFSKSEICQTR